MKKKLLCIDASRPNPKHFFGKWIVEGEIYTARIVDISPTPYKPPIQVELDEIPGENYHADWRYGFRPDRFIDVGGVGLSECVNVEADPPNVEVHRAGEEKP